MEAPSTPDVNDSAQIKLADLLANARREARQIHALQPDLVPTSADAAYAVNQQVTRLLGWKPLGWKIAGTTAAVRVKLGLDSPIYGRTYQRFAVASPVRFVTAELLDPLVECEFFVILDRDLPARDLPWTMPEVIAAIGIVHAGIEVAECRFPNNDLPPLPAVLADGSASGRYVFGDTIEDWRTGLAGVAVTLEVDGVPRRQGCGADVMGDPLWPLLWLAEARRRCGDGLQAGEMISTGSTTGMLPIRTGQQVKAMFGRRATVSIAFD